MKPLHFLFLATLLISFCSLGQSPSKKQVVQVNHPYIHSIGRIDRTDPTSYRFSHPGVSFRVKFQGDYCRVLLTTGSSHYKNYYAVLVDNQAPQIFAIGNEDSSFQVLIEKSNSSHTMTIFKRTENFVGIGIFRGLELEQGKELLPLGTQLNRKIEFIGNSITCGYGNEGASPSCSFLPETENNYMAYGAITARQLGAEYMAVAYSGKGLIQNYDLHDKESLPFLYDRIIPSDSMPKWNYTTWQPDAVVINLGTNDFAHAVPDSLLFVTGYIQFLERIRRNYPEAVLFCIEGCMTKDNWPVGINSLAQVKQYIVAAVQNLEKKGEKKIYTFFPTTMQVGEIGCDWHPNIIRHQKMADELTHYLKEKMSW